MNQPVASVDERRIGGRGKAGRPDLGNAITVDQNIGSWGAMTCDID